MSWLRTLRASIPRKTVFGLFVGVVVYWYWYWHWYVTLAQIQPVNWNSRREAVKNAFSESWDGYTKYAWGYDNYHPVSRRGSQMSPSGLGWTIIDSLDTMILMNLTAPLVDARKWLQRSLTWDQDQDVNTFETTIRMLGGLLSAHYLSQRFPEMSSRRDFVYLAKATDLADRLLAAYNSPSGIPYASVNLGTRQGIRSHADGGASSMAEAGTVQLEMKYLAFLTGNETYWRVAERVIQLFEAQHMEDGLLPIYIHPDNGRFTTHEIRLGSRGDSYYEYLVKQYLQTSQKEPVYSTLWDEAFEGIQKHLITYTKHAGRTFVAELPGGIGQPLSPKMDHLVCFLPGTIALAATSGRPLAKARANRGFWTAEKEEQMRLAAELTETCYGMYAVTATGLAPEIVWFEAEKSDLEPRLGQTETRGGDRKRRHGDWKQDYEIRPLDVHNLQRPETVESLYFMWYVTRDEKYRRWGWDIFQAFEKYTKLGEEVEGRGYTSLADVKKVPPPRRDNMESFWLAETLKYLYLLFSPPDFLPVDEVVFNTEAHIFPRFVETRWKTGWEPTS